MGPQKRSKKALEAPRANMFLMEPEKLTLVTDEQHPLYDERIHMALPESLVKSVMAKNVIEPIVVRKEGSEIVVIDERQRTRAAIEANKRLVASGHDPLRVPVIIRRSNDAVAAVDMVELNEIRFNDDVLTKARKAQRLSERGRTTAEIADAFGVNEATVNNWFTLLACSGKVRAAVEDGRLRLTDAVREFSNIPQHEQNEKLDAYIAANPTRAAKKAARESGENTRGIKITSGARMRLLAKHESLLTEKDRILVAWIRGKASNGDLVEAFPRLAKALEG